MSNRSPRHALLVLPALALVILAGCVEAESDDASDTSGSTADVSTIPGSLGSTDSSPSSTVSKGGVGSSDGTNDGSTPTIVPSRPSGGTDTGNVTPSSGATLALTVLQGIRQENEVSAGYDRDLFRHWIDADGDRCNTREEVLIAESRTPAQVDAYGCTVVAGDWFSPYDGRDHADPSDLDIDHVVALKEAWDSGAYSWTSTQRERFANDLSDPRALIAVTSGVNRSKSDKDPSQWLPPNGAYVCTYISDWIAVKAAWGLSMDQSEWGRLKNLLNGQCAGTTIASWAGVADPTRGTVPGSRPSSTTVPAPVPGESSDSQDSGGDEALPTIKPGAFCSPQGALGVYKGTVYLCATTRTSGEPYSDGRARWRQR